MDIGEAYAFFDSQNYSNREMEIIYGVPEGLTTDEFYDLIDKAEEKYDDWRIVEHLYHRYDTKGNLQHQTIKTIKITKNEDANIYQFCHSTKTEILKKFAFEEKEKLLYSLSFSDEIEAKIKLVISDEYDYPYLEGVLAKNGIEVAVIECEDDITGKWNFCDYPHDDIYTVEVIIED